MPVEEWSNKIWVVELEPEPAFSEDLLDLLADLQERQTIPDLVLDLSRLERLNSAQLGQILRVRKLTVDRGSRLRLAGPRDPIWALFLTIGLDKVFEFSEDVPSALAALQM